MEKHTPPGLLANSDARVGESAVLETLRAFREEEIRREQAMVLLAVEWARLNPAQGRTEGDHLYYSALTPMEEMWDELAVRGCPHVDDLSIPAFADAAGMTEFQAGKLLREAILLVFLLPKVWERTAQGQIEVWRARKLAEKCWGLTPEALAYIDRNMSLTTARHTEKVREGIITEARLRYMAEEVQAEEEAAKEQRCVALDWEESPGAGVAALWGVLDIPDARDLETAVAAGAEAIKQLGSDAPLEVRRSWALGDLARCSQFLTPQLPLAVGPALTESQRAGAAPRYHPDCACQQGTLPGRAGLSSLNASADRPSWNGLGAPRSHVMLYLHLTPEALARTSDPPDRPGQRAEGRALPTGGPDGENTELPPIRVEGNGIPTGTVLTPETVRGWFSRPSPAPAPRITFRPVLDLEDHQHVDAYEVPERIKEQVGLRDGGCAFPWCLRKARNTDCDHTIPWQADGEGGPTCSCNLAPLCRRHHRAKTHADNHRGSRYTWWRYESLGEGKYLWEGPNGTRLLRTNTGVYDVSSERRSSGPLTPDRLARAAELPERIDASGRGQGSMTAASRVLERIRHTLPEAEDYEGRFPPAPGERPFTMPSKPPSLRPVQIPRAGIVYAPHAGLKRALSKQALDAIDPWFGDAGQAPEF